MSTPRFSRGLWLSWFLGCVSTVGPESVGFYFAQLKEACSIHKIEDRGALMSEIFHSGPRATRFPPRPGTLPRGVLTPELLDVAPITN